MSEVLGVPAVCQTHLGIDELGPNCRVDPSVTVMRWGPPRQALCLAEGVSLYANVRVVLGDVAAAPEVGLHIGARTIVNVGAYLSGEGGLHIGQDVLIGAHARLLSAGHAIDEGDEIIARNRITRAPVTVGDGAWIGAGATVLEGVSIGRGAVVAAGAVVKHDVPPGMVAAGIPARIVRARRKSGDTQAPSEQSWLRRCWHWLRPGA